MFAPDVTLVTLLVLLFLHSKAPLVQHAHHRYADIQVIYKLDVAKLRRNIHSASKNCHLGPCFLDSKGGLSVCLVTRIVCSWYSTLKDATLRQHQRVTSSPPYLLSAASQMRALLC
jgi:hypothetical protein